MLDSPEADEPALSPEELRKAQLAAKAPVLTGSGAILKSLEMLGVTDVFGLPGGAIMPFYDELMSADKIRHILVRHEQGAGHAAEGYASASGKLGVAIATSGPGATNLVTAIADAHMDSVPLLAITGQVFSTSMGTDAFQEVDISGVTMPITKHSFLVTDPAEIPGVMAAAVHIATTGRPGPVLVDVTKDAQQKSAPFIWPPEIDLPGYHPVTKANAKQVQVAAEMIAAAKKPVLYVGGGVVRAGAHKELAAFANKVGAPVVTTLMARGAFPDSSPLNLGMPGMHGNYTAVMAMQEADLLIALGARFDDRVTGARDKFAPDAKVIHVDIDPAELGKVRFAHVPIAGDAKSIITEMIKEIEKLGGADGQPDRDAWRQTLSGWQEKYPLVYGDHEPGKLLKPQFVIEKLAEACPPDTILCSGVGQHQMWAAQFINYENPRTWLNSGGLGTMGYAVPAAMGAKVGLPDTTVWAIDGDGCFQMTNQELATCTINNIPIKVALINNSSLGMVRQWQTLFYDKRYSQTDLQSHRFPDFVKLAEAYGCHGLQCDSPDQVDVTIEKALALNDAPVVIDFVVHKDAMVWPMVAAGASNDDILVAREMAPKWERED